MAFVTRAGVRSYAPGVNRRTVVGVLLCLLGTVWIFQGIGTLKGSFMTGQGIWTLLGIIMVIVGVSVLRGRRRA